MNLRILLIENTPADATMFIDQIQQQMGNDVQVDWVETLGEAFSRLETGALYDQIWLDPSLPRLEQKDVGKALATLKTYVQSGDLHLLGSPTPLVTSQAAQHNVEVLGKDALVSGTQLLQLVQAAIAKKSGGTATVRVEMARFEGRLIRLEHQAEEFSKALDTIRQALDPLVTVPYEMSVIKDLLQKQDARAQEQQQIKVKRLDATQAIVITLITALIAPILLVLVPKLADRWLGDKPAPTTNPTPAPSPKAKANAATCLHESRAQEKLCVLIDPVSDRLSDGSPHANQS